MYYIAGSFAWVARLSSSNASELLIVAPKIAQAIIAAADDYYTWKLANKVYGQGSFNSWATVETCTAIYGRNPVADSPHS